MAKKKKFGAILEKQTKQIPVVKQKAPKTISTNVSTDGMRSAVSSTAQSVAKSARQKAEEDRSARMRQGLSSVVRSSFNRQMSRPTYINKSTVNRLNQLNKTVTNPLAPIKQKQVTGNNGVGGQRLFSKERSLLNNTKFVTGGQGVGGKTVVNSPIGRVKSSVLAPVKEDIQNNYYDAVRKVGMKGSRNERKVYVPLSQRDENGQISTNQRRLENAARGGNRKAQVEAALARTKAQTLSGHTYDQYVNAELNKKGLLGQDYILRSKDPSKEAMDYRKRYGFDKEALEAVQAIANNTPASGDYTERFNGQDNGSAIDRLKFGFGESYRARNIEDTLRRQYGVELSDEDQAKLDAVRDSGGYMVGNMLGQASQFAMTAPYSGVLEGSLMARMGLKGGRAAINTTADALKYAGARIGADQILSAPINLLDAMKEDNVKDIVKRFGMNSGMDIIFGGLIEIPAFRKNYKFVKAIKANDAANAMEAGAKKTAAKVSAQKQLSKAIDSMDEQTKRQIVLRLNETAENARIQRAMDFKNDAELLFQDGYVASRDAVNASAEHGIAEADSYEWQVAYDAARRNGADEEDAIEFADASLEDAITNNHVRQPRETEVDRASETLANVETPNETLAKAQAQADANDVLLNARREADNNTGIIGANERPMPTQEERGTYGQDVIARDRRRLYNQEEIRYLRDRERPRNAYEEDLWNEEFERVLRENYGSSNAEDRAFAAADRAVAVDRETRLINARERIKNKENLERVRERAKANEQAKEKTRGQEIADGLVKEKQARQSAEEAVETVEKATNTNSVDDVIEAVNSNDHVGYTNDELQSARAKLEDAMRDDPMNTDAEDAIDAIDQELYRRGEEPQWDIVEPRDRSTENAMPREKAEEPKAKTKQPKAEAKAKQTSESIEQPKAENAETSTNNVEQTNAESNAEVKQKTKSSKKRDSKQKENAKKSEEEKRFANAKTSKEKYPNGTPKYVNGKKVSKGSDTAYPAASDEARRITDKQIENGETTVTSINIKDSMKKGADKFFENPEKAFDRIVDTDKYGFNGLPKGYDDFGEYSGAFKAAINYAQKNGDAQAEAKLWEVAVAQKHYHGQSQRLWQEVVKGTRAGKERVVQNIKDELEEGFEKVLKGKKLNIDDDLLNRFLDEEDGIEASRLLKEIDMQFWNQIPATWSEKFNAWRYFSMLANPRTHARNIIGNSIFAVPRRVKNIIGTGLESVAVKKHWIEEVDRIKSVAPPAEYKKFAHDRFNANVDVFRGETKTDISGQGAGFRPQGGKILSAGDQSGKPRIVQLFNEKADKMFQGAGNLLDKEDVMAMRWAYQDQYARAMKARGWDLDYLAKNPSAAAELDEIAVEEALKATYRDASKVASFMNQHFKAKPNSSLTKKILLALTVDANTPFIKTPINLAKRALEYSPFGLIRSVGKLNTAIKSGNAKAVVKALDSFAAGTTGTALFAFGMFAANTGKIHGEIGDNKEGYYKKELGAQDYSLDIKIPTADGKGWEGSVTLDWAQPASIPFFFGVSVYENFSEDGFQIKDVGKVIETVGNSLNPLIDQSVLQGPAGLINAARNSDGYGDMFLSLVLQSGTSYISQYWPTIFSQIARTVDPVRRDTSSTASTKTTRFVDKWARKQLARVPGASKLLEPYIDSHGQEEVSPIKNPALRLLYETTSPAYVKTKTKTKVDEEVSRLNEISDEPIYLSSYPPNGNSLKLNGESIQMSEKDLTSYKRTKGQEQYKELEKLFNSSEYASMSDAEKLEAYDKVMKASTKTAKDETLIKMGKDPWEVTADSLSGKKADYEEAKAAGFTYKEYDSLMKSKEWDSNGNGRATKDELIAWLDGKDWTSEQKRIIFGKFSTAKNPYADGATKAGSNGGGKSSSKRGRSGRGGGGGSSKVKARAKTASEKRFTALQKMQAPTTGKGIEALADSAKGLTKSQKKALLKLMQKKLDV